MREQILVPLLEVYLLWWLPPEGELGERRLVGAFADKPGAELYLEALSKLKQTPPGGWILEKVKVFPPTPAT